MAVRFGKRTLTLVAAAALTAFTVGTGAAHADTGDDTKILLKGSTTASYFWDDSSGRAGDTGLPASGKPMQKKLAASPSWPLLTEGYVVYKGKKMPFFVGDRGPGNPSNNGIMLDLDAKTFADLTGGTFNSRTLGVDGVGGQGHIKVDYVITKWGDGVGKKNHPVAFSSGAWSRMDRNPAEPPQILAEKRAEQSPEQSAEQSPEQSAEKRAEQSAEQSPEVKSAPGSAGSPIAAPKPDVETAGAAGALALVGGLAAVGGAAFAGRERITSVKR